LFCMSHAIAAHAVIKSPLNAFQNPSCSQRISHIALTSHVARPTSCFICISHVTRWQLLSQIDRCCSGTVLTCIARAGGALLSCAALRELRAQGCAAARLLFGGRKRNAGRGGEGGRGGEFVKSQMKINGSD
jgi:hypothetical protein